jgi:hypothetical protein
VVVRRRFVRRNELGLCKLCGQWHPFISRNADGDCGTPIVFDMDPMFDSDVEPLYQNVLKLPPMRVSPFVEGGVEVSR